MAVITCKSSLSVFAIEVELPGGEMQPRIWLETLALALILQLVEAGEATLVNSSVLEFENSKNPFSLRQDWMARCLEQATAYQRVDASIREHAETLEGYGLRAIDPCM